MVCYNYNPSWFTELQPGTQAEWVQVIISCLGIIFIIKTLKAQTKVTRLEQLRFIRENSPIFKFVLDQLNMVLKMEVGDNHVQKYKIYITHNPAGFNVPGIETYNDKGLIKNQVVDWAFTFSLTPSSPNIQNAIELTVFFTDLYGFSYFQVITVFLDGGNVSFPPIPLGNKIDILKYSKETLANYGKDSVSKPNIAN